MALKMNKLVAMKSGVAVLLVVNIGAAWPVYEKFAEDPMSALPEVAPTAPTRIQIDVDKDSAALGITGGMVPSQLAGWDPFKAPRLGRQPEAVDTSTEVQERPLAPIATDNLSLLGIINLNGSYLALVKVGGEPPVELKRGATIPGTDGIRCLEIRRDGVMLAQQGALNTFLGLTRPQLNGQPWYRAEDAAQIRGTVELRERRRR